VGLAETCGSMNHVFIGQADLVGDDPRHSKSRSGTARCYIASDPVRQCKETCRILRALARTSCHVELIGGFDEQIHTRVVRLGHNAAARRWRWQAEPAHHRASIPIGTRDLVTVSGDAAALNEPLRGYTWKCRLPTPNLAVNVRPIRGRRPPTRRRSYHLSTPLWGSGVENSGQNIDESLESRTSSY
jgi:hypothetical protein